MLNKIKNIGSKLLVLLAFMLGVCGCSSITDAHSSKADMMNSFMSGDNEAVKEELLEQLDEESSFSAVNTGDEIMWRLEAGSFYFHIGEYQKSIEHFTAAEKLIEAYDYRAVVSARDAGAEIGSALVNLNALPYRGLCRDRMALEIYKSLAYLGCGREDAFRAQLKRLRGAQKKVQDDYRDFFENENKELKAAQQKNPGAAAKSHWTPDQLAGNAQNTQFTRNLEEMRKVGHRGYGNFLNPAATYLSGIGLLRDGHYDNARIEFKRLYQAMPNNPMAQRYYVTSLNLTNRDVPSELAEVQPFDFPLDRDCVYVVSALGRSAAFKEIEIYFPVMAAWAGCEFYTPDFQNCTVKADGRNFVSWPLADMDGIIVQEFEERLPAMITRTILSTAIKEGIRYAGTAVIAQHDEGLALLFFLLSTTYNAATNTADTRSWEMLPQEFKVTQLPMPQERKLEIELSGSKNCRIQLELPAENCRSVIVFVSAPSKDNVACHVLPIASK